MVDMGDWCCGMGCCWIGCCGMGCGMGRGYEWDGLLIFVVSV